MEFIAKFGALFTRHKQKHKGAGDNQYDGGFIEMGFENERISSFYQGKEGRKQEGSGLQFKGRSDNEMPRVRHSSASTNVSFSHRSITLIITHTIYIERGNENICRCTQEPPRATRKRRGRSGSRSEQASRPCART